MLTAELSSSLSLGSSADVAGHLRNRYRSHLRRMFCDLLSGLVPWPAALKVLGKLSNKNYIPFSFKYFCAVNICEVVNVNVFYFNIVLYCRSLLL